VGSRPPQPIPYGRQYVDEQDVRAVAEALASDWLTQGPRVDAFEEEMAAYCGASWGVAFSSGTAALHAACAALDLEPGDEVITSPITFVASANAPYHCGAKPVFADVEDDTVNLSPAAFEAAITPRTRAVIPVHFAGHPCEMDAIREIAARSGLRVVTDAAHALGAIYRGRRIGELSDLCVLSFHPVKHITTGEGGMVLGDDLAWRERLRRFRHHDIVRSGTEGPWFHELHRPGFNYRLTDFQSALGSSQLKKVDRFVARRRELAALYEALLGGSDLLRTPRERSGCAASYHLYVVRLRLERLGVSRRDVFEKLHAAGIACQVHYIPVHLQPFYVEHLGTARGDCPVAENYYRECLTLPLYYALRDEEVRYVADTLLEILEGSRA
jgi:UDP-4-amino-4,6-dideoxy-N-acetyl-beta-L-altrosamine transaminase